ncbi:hypothetical protein BC937DRAFT_95659 [Endogone sp. FLAS-F59071]|nr:hypothetical protein BC937DRAFT_95659 [Endogone sp. FLAS-F59071]|eukprot:RUS13218.1 hypothetical protein BC937DRAFT_95659 [Endogone sp. FLAS-F59071]
MPCPRLPFELLEDIFFHLQPSSSNALPIDLLACSLVDTTWHSAAGALIPSRILKNLLHHKLYTEAELARLAHILAISRDLGVDYAGQVRIITVDCTALPFSEPDPKAQDSLFVLSLMSIFAVCTHLHTLHIVTPGFYHQVRHELLRSLLLRMRNHNYNLSGLVLTGDGYWEDLSFGPDLASLIARSSRTLRRIDTDAVVHGPSGPVHAALSRCNGIRALRVRTASGAGLVSLALRWPLLESLAFYIHAASDLARVLAGLPLGLRRLRVGLARGCGVRKAAGALHELAGKCLGVTHLTVRHQRRHDGVIDDGFLALLGRTASGLKRLDLSGCGGVTGKGVVVGWSELRYLNISGCPVVPEFVEEVLQQCAKLRVICVGCGGEDPFASSLVTRGFEHSGFGKWARTGEGIAEDDKDLKSDDLFWNFFEEGDDEN